MLSSLQSFLPQALQSQSQQPRVASPDNLSDDEQTSPRTPVEESTSRRRPTKGSNETFIIVRPPPSKTNHPLNLQVQLVPPSSKERSRRTSVDEQGALTRTTSRRSQSETSTIYSSYSSAASVNSVGSTASSAPGRRMIIPLYNLQAHNVMTNVVVDAGTDAKIAKFYKRGLEIIGLAVLEPTEIHGAGGQPQAETSTLLGPTISITSAAGRSTPEPSGISPAASRLSLSSTGHGSTYEAPTVSTPEHKGGAKKLFGRFFKRKEASTSSAGAPASRDSSPSKPEAGLTTPRAPSKRASLLVPATVPGVTSSSNEVPVFLMPAVLGIQPVLSAETFPPRGRASMYTWTVRRWLKGSPETMIGSVLDSALRATGKERDAKGNLGVETELRFEWTRGTKKDRKRKGDAPTSPPQANKDLGVSSAAPSSTSLVSQATPSIRDVDPTSRRSTDTSRNKSASPTRRSDNRSLRSTDEGHYDDDDGNDSDPEDSETPWICTLVAHASLGLGDVGQDSIRTKVATLSPTPHHPKVVAALKVPFPLPDVNVDDMTLRPRVITPAGIARPALEHADSTTSALSGGSSTSASRRGREPGLQLTAEEIKDIISTTGMWLVIRECIGGVGRERRKGDGWKIRG